jgi:hypothetical protein
LTYLISPKLGHRFVGYLEEQAVHTYSVLLEQIDSGCLPGWANEKAPEAAIKYYNLNKDAMMRDVILAIRADEAIHREVNHHLSDIPQDSSLDKEEIFFKQTINQASEEKQQLSN